MSTQRKLFWVFLYLALAVMAANALCDKIVIVVHVRGLMVPGLGESEPPPALQRPRMLFLTSSRAWQRGVVAVSDHVTSGARMPTCAGAGSISPEVR